MPSKRERSMTNADMAQEILECPVCLEIPDIKPVYQCVNGHLLCRSCYSKVKICPLCRKKLDPKDPLRNLTAEKLLDSLKNNETISGKALGKEVSNRPRRNSVISLPCKYASNGCDATWKKNGEAVQHEKLCKYRLVFCPDLRCFRRIPMAHLFAHINDDHPVDDFSKLSRSSVNFSLVIKPANYRDETFWKPAIMQLGHSKFFRECRRTREGQWYFWVYMEGSPEEASQFSTVIKLFDSKKQEVVCFAGCAVLPLDVGPADVSNYTVMTVQDPVIQSIDNNGKLSFSVEIKRK